MSSQFLSAQELKKYILEFNDYDLENPSVEELRDLIKELKINFLIPLLKTNYTINSLGLSSNERWLVRAQIERINTLFSVHTPCSLAMHERHYDTTQRQLDLCISERMHISLP